MVENNMQTEPRYVQRQSDRIAAEFYEACRLGKLDTARKLMLALEYEVESSTLQVKGDMREDGNDLASIRARFRLELARANIAATARLAPEFSFLS